MYNKSFQDDMANYNNQMSSELIPFIVRDNKSISSMR